MLTYDRDARVGVLGLGRDEAQLSGDPLQRLYPFERGPFDTVTGARLAPIAVRSATFRVARAAGDEVHILPTEAEELAAPEAEAQRQDVQRVEPFAVRRLEDVARLVDVRPLLTCRGHGRV